MTVEVLYHSGCPHARSAIDLVQGCVGRLGLGIAIVENEGDHPSPTVLVNGQDVMGIRPPSGRACRLDLPTEERILDALRHASVTKRRGANMPVRVGTTLKTILVLVITVVVICAGVFAWLKFAPRRVPPGQPPLATLGAGSLSVFKDTFNAADGEVRVLAMLSPT